MAMDLSQKHYRENGTLERVVGGGGAVEHYDILGKFVERIEWPNGAVAFYAPPEGPGNAKNGREVRLEWPEQRR
ncbi:MAG: hypothetical protein KC503_17350 [Myxococcales bacterium]|nr:hypothetical protein [Myxococcales bacterium]